MWALCCFYLLVCLLGVGSLVVIFITVHAELLTKAAKLPGTKIYTLAGTHGDEPLPPNIYPTSMTVLELYLDRDKNRGGYDSQTWTPLWYISMSQRISRIQRLKNLHASYKFEIGCVLNLLCNIKAHFMNTFMLHITGE